MFINKNNIKKVLNPLCVNLENCIIEHGKLKNLLYRLTNRFEYGILSILIEHNKTIVAPVKNQFIETGSSLYNIIYFIQILQRLNTNDFLGLAGKIDKLSKRIDGSTMFIALKRLKNICKLLGSINLYLKASLSIEQLIYILKKNTRKNDLNYIFSKMKFKSLKQRDLGIESFYNIFSTKTLGFYETLISKYLKFHRFTDYYKDLSITTRKSYILTLNYLKGNYNKNAIHDLALRYIGKQLVLPFARKAFNLSYRSYRLFLFAFNLKPDQLRRITAKGRKGKNGGDLVSHTSRFQLYLKNLLLLSNFCQSHEEAKYFIEEYLISINGKLTGDVFHGIRPFDMVYFDDSISKERKTLFAKQLMTEENNSFIYKVSSFLEYGFKSFCFIVLPSIFREILRITPALLESNAGRFSIEKR
jgi:hypothetical protein